ncbi:murein DD-endopeptidase MepM/ murein hydrolase activator NlpD [Desulfitispora alkaliphila]|uniref:LysM peptidoglycan-binding domain-containing M23 family metallopeptidase n=1 Tax=Desulfitispora alkaliphila TaxID=622674 RepID=UPI003D23869D
MASLDLNSYLTDKEKKPVVIGAIILLCSILAIGLFVANSTSYAVVVDGEQVAVVNSEALLNQALADVAEDKAQEIGQSVKVASDLEVKEIKRERNTTDLENLREILADKLAYTTAAVAIVVDGEEKLVVENQEIAEELIERLIEEYKPGEDSDLELKDIEIVESIEFTDAEIGIGEFTEAEMAFNLLANGVEVVETYEVVSGDTLWTIARDNNMRVADLQEANPQLETELLSIGQELSLVKLEPMVNVVAELKQLRTEAIAFETTYQNNSNMYRGQNEVVQAGTRGEREVTYHVVQQNGRTMAREEVASTVVKEPQNRVVARGTKTIVASRGGGDVGRLGWPVNGTITSPFGPRGGGYHHGLDIGARTGTSIRAADAGRVTFSGWRGAYGYMIEIDHGDGVSTRYAHNSANLVSVGDRVSRGQVIGRVGSTGRSTGPHVHFEVRVNGRAQNPINYLP